MCQLYTIHFCTEELPAKFATPFFPTPLSERWQRVAIQQAAGIAQSWRSNYSRAKAEFEQRVVYYEQRMAADPLRTEAPPQWREWRMPTLRQLTIQTNANVAKLEPPDDTTFDYWLTISTLTPRKMIQLPVTLSARQKKLLGGRKLNTSMTLSRRKDGWWLTLTFDEQVKPTSNSTSPVVAVDVGITQFITTSNQQHYGTFHGKLSRRHRADRLKRQRKAKLRACLEKKGVTNLPSTANPRLARFTRQEINRAVNLFYADHAGHQIALESLSVFTMRFKSRRMNAYLSASNLGHLPTQPEWGARKRGLLYTFVKSAYSSQECSRCHYTARENRPTQQTFCCQRCGFRAQADYNAALNLAARLGDEELRSCTTVEQVKALLDRRHHATPLLYGGP